MSNVQYVIPNGDVGATAFTVPGDQDGGEGDASFDVTTYETGVAHRAYIHIENGFNENVDITLQGSHYLDENMDSASDDGSSITVNSGSVDFFTVTSGHAFLEVKVAPAADPTSGNLTITFQSRVA